MCAIANGRMWDSKPDGESARRRSGGAGREPVRCKTRRRCGVSVGFSVNCDAPDRIRTCDLRFRKPSLYPAELRALHMAL